MVERVQITIRGAVQGVGFRPFIYRLARKMCLAGFVYNSPLGVFLEVEGEKPLLDRFILRIEQEKPPAARITGMEFSFLDPRGYREFEIRKSAVVGKKSALILPDIAVCPDCLREMMDPHDRRHLYPFINCTNCGPRFTIIEALPYDRPNTSMKIFEMCEDCRREYENPADRRFHAQPIACPVCGPHMELWTPEGRVSATRHEALLAAAEAIRNGKILALKGLGGFHLIAAAGNEEAARLLRERKHRDEKPFALMFPDLEMIRTVCEVSTLEERLLRSPEAPIVLLRRKPPVSNRLVCSAVAPGNPYLGVMVPYTPLHYLLLRELGFPIVATSGNISDETICVDETAALAKLGGIADLFLVHNRPIVRHADDSIVRVIRGREMVLRRARGYAPFPVILNEKQPQDGPPDTALAVGGQLKSSIALKVNENVFLSQYIGDLSNGNAFETFRKLISDFQRLYEAKPAAVVCDAHPDYLSTKFAAENFIDVQKVQHHFAHVAACRAENKVEGPAVGVSWDGTGYGLDGTIWGGEFFLSDEKTFSHFARFRKFPLPGGEKAIVEPRRCAAGLLFEMCDGEEFGRREVLQRHFTASELKMLQTMLEKKINSPETSSAGRLFDAVASILDVSQITSYEGQSAMKLEFAAAEAEFGAYEFRLIRSQIFVVDWEPMIRGIIRDLNRGMAVEIIASKFHSTLAEIILAVVKNTPFYRVLLSGGCFQNAILTERTVHLLEKNNFSVYLHQRVPPNDGGIALGQIAAMGVKMEQRKTQLKEQKTNSNEHN